MIDTPRMPALRAARVCRRLAANPGTELGAEMQGLSHPFTWADFALADLQIAASRGLAPAHWARPDIAEPELTPLQVAVAKARAAKWKSRIQAE